jgi:hypothetical protein
MFFRFLQNVNAQGLTHFNDYETSQDSFSLPLNSLVYTIDDKTFKQRKKALGVFTVDNEGF